MNDQPTDNPGPAVGDDGPTIDPAHTGPPSQTPSADPAYNDTVAVDASAVKNAPPGLPDLSMAGESAAPSFHAKVEPPKLDGYDVIRAIGEGGMGTVWRAVQLSTRRDVALKLMSAAGFASERARQRFDREVEITAKLEHPNIARVYDSGLNRGVYFYAMELIDGVPLDQFVSSRHLARPEILRLFVKVCRAVDHAHERGVIHRDLKPGNILVTADAQPHVLDFGLAKALEQAGKEAGISIDGEVAGTPGFMSPEQAAGKLDIDARCDVYSLGVILYRLLTGDSPHDLSGTYLDVLRRVSEEEPRRPRAADRTMNRELEALLLRALQRDRARRYKTAGELAGDVESFLSGDPITAKAPTTLYFLTKRARKHRVKIVTAATVAVLVIAAASLAFYLNRSRHTAIEANGETIKQAAKAADEQRKKEIATAATAVLDGDRHLANKKWTDARAAYLLSLDHLSAAGVSPMPAFLGLWDVGRTAPAPLLTIPLPPRISTKARSPGPAAVSTAPVFLSDSRRALAGYEDGSVRLLDLATGQTLRTFIAHNHPVRSIAVCANGMLAVSGSDDGSLKLWDIDSGTLKREFRDAAAPLKNWVTRVAISPDQRLVLSVSGASAQTMLSSAPYDDTLGIWEIASGKQLLTTNRPAGILDLKKTVTQVSFSADSTKILTASAAVVVWNANDGKPLASMPQSATTAAFSDDGKTVVAGSTGGAIRVLDVLSGQVTTPRTDGNDVSAVYLNQKRDRIISASEDAFISAMTVGGTVLWNHPGRTDATYCAISPDGTLALTAGDSNLAVWLASPPAETRELARAGPFPQAAISADGRLALARRSPRGAVGQAAQGAVLFDVATGISLAPGGFPSGPCDAVAFSRDGRTIALLRRNELAVWSLDSPHEVRKWAMKAGASAGDLGAMAISPDGLVVAVGGADNSLLLFGPGESNIPRKFSGHAGPITAVAFSGDGRQIITASQDRTARVWNAEGGGAIAILRGHEASVNAVALSDDGKFAVTGSGDPKNAGGNDSSVRIWEIPGGQLLGTLVDPAGRVRSVAISGNGEWIAAGDDDSVIICDRHTVRPLRTLNGGNAPTLALAFDQTGQRLIRGADTLSVWDLGLPARQKELRPAAAAALARTAPSPLDPAELLALGNWYASVDESAWATAFFDQARTAGAAVPAMQAWRCDWKRGDAVSAERNINLLTAQDAPAFYVKLCREAMASGK